MSDSRGNDSTPLAAGELQRRAISGSAWTAVMTVVTVPMAFIGNAIVARSLGVVSYGHLAFLTSAMVLAYGLANFGFATALVQRGSRAEAGGRRDEAEELLRGSAGFHLVVELPILLIVAFALTRNDPAWEAGASLVAMVVTCALGTSALSITIENRTAAAARLAMFVALFVQGATVTTAVLTSSASAVWVVRTLMPALALGLNLFLLDPRRRRLILHPRLPRFLGRAFWHYALLSWASGLIGLLVFSRSEIFILQAFHRHHALGLFALAFGLSQVMTAPADAMLHALLPAVAGILSTWPERAAAAFERSSRLSTLMSGALAAVAIPTLVYAVPIIYGGGFGSSAWLFVPLALVSCFQSANNPVIAFVNGRQRGGLILKTNVTALAVDVLLALLLIPSFGAWGAVAANVGGQLVALLRLVVAEPLAMSSGIRGLLRLHRTFALGTAVGAMALGVGRAFDSSPSVAVAAAFLVGCVGFYGAVYLTRAGMTLEDREAVLDSVAARMRPWVSRLLAPVTRPAAA